jgi:hypothetical protein
MKNIIFILFLSWATRSSGQSLDLDSVFKDFSFAKSITFTDTGFIILSKPHFMCYFISSSNCYLEEMIQTSNFARFCHIEDESLESIFFENPKSYYIKQNANCKIIRSGRTYQTGISYFRAIVTVEIPLFEMKYSSPNEHRLSEHYFSYGQHEMRVYPIFDAYFEVLKCLKIIPIKSPKCKITER